MGATFQTEQRAHFRNQFIQALEAKGWSVGQLSEATGLPRALVYQWRSGKYVPRGQYQTELIRVLGMKASDFVKPTNGQSHKEVKPPKVPRIMPARPIAASPPTVRLELTLSVADAMRVLRLLHSSVALGQGDHP
jgi:transcriptional regulator with XRE-family HTH domain